MKTKVIKNDFEEKYKRALADYQNLIKRNEQQRLMAIKYANQELISRFLPLVDDLQNAAKHSREQGLELVLKHFLKILAENGVAVIAAAKGEKFDPAKHECVEVKEGQAGIILKQISVGFKLHDRLIRPIRVIVGKKEAKDE